MQVSTHLAELEHPAGVTPMGNNTGLTQDMHVLVDHDALVVLQPPSFPTAWDGGPSRRRSYGWISLLCFASMTKTSNRHDKGT